MKGQAFSSFETQFPVFALVFCILRKDDCIGDIVSAMQRLKMVARPAQMSSSKAASGCIPVLWLIGQYTASWLPRFTGIIRSSSIRSSMVMR
jgi:hypothetical protein